MPLLMQELMNEVRAPMERPLSYLSDVFLGAALGFCAAVPLSWMAANMGLDEALLNYFFTGVIGIGMIFAYLVRAYELMLIRTGQ